VCRPIRSCLVPWESGGHHLYRCLGIKAPWPLFRVGFSSHRPGARRGGQGPPQHDSDE
ncbi:hypothetical protein KUCAC02_031931, partial [Chaenocephalus aceratus]